MKNYLALVSVPPAGGVTGQRFEWRDTIRKVPNEPRAEIVPEGTPGGQAAQTHGSVLAANDARLLLSLEPHTGRMHQLRVQAASRGMPVIGDLVYGGVPIANVEGGRSSPIALHAWRIRYTDPDSGEPVEVTCSLPPGPPWDEWLGFLNAAPDVTC